jgi:hypothetical protein
MNWINKTTDLEFKGKQYKTRILPVTSNNSVTLILIADEAIGEDIDYEWSELPEEIADRVYVWVEAEYLELPAEELLSYLIDEYEVSSELKIAGDFPEPSDKLRSGAVI